MYICRVRIPEILEQMVKKGIIKRKKFDLPKFLKKPIRRLK